MSGVRPTAFPDRSPPPSCEETCWLSRFPCGEFPHMHGVFDSAALKTGSRVSSAFMLPSPCQNEVGTPNLLFRS